MVTRKDWFAGAVLLVAIIVGVWLAWHEHWQQPRQPLKILLVIPEEMSDGLGRFLASQLSSADIDVLALQTGQNVTDVAVSALAGEWVDASIEMREAKDYTLTVVLRNKQGTVFRKQWPVANSSGTLVALIHAILESLEITVSTRYFDYLVTDVELGNYLHGRRAQGQGDYPLAIEYYLSALNSAPQFELAANELVESYLKCGRYVDALSLTERMLAEQGDAAYNSRWQLLMARAQHGLGDDAAATVSYFRAQQNLGNVEAPYIQLVRRLAMAHFTKARKDYRSALQHLEYAVVLADQVIPSLEERASVRLQLAQWYQETRELGWSNLQQQRQVLMPLQPYFDQLNNELLVMRAYNLILESYIYGGEFEQASALIHQAEAHLDALDARPDELFYYYFLAAMVQSYTGDFARAAFYQKAMAALQQFRPSLYFPAYIAYADIQRYYIQRDVASALELSERVVDEMQQSPELTRWAKSLRLLVYAQAAPLSILRAELLAMDAEPSVSGDGLDKSIGRARAMLVVREGDVARGLSELEDIERSFRNRGELLLADQVAFDMLYVLLDLPELDYQPVLARVTRGDNYSYSLYMIRARFALRDGDLQSAALLLREVKRRSGDLWSEADEKHLRELLQKLGQRKVSSGV